MTIGTTWGYRASDGPLKSGTELIRTLVDVAGRGGNLLLNVGPTKDGAIPEEFEPRLAEIGRWMAHSGESLYGASGSPLPDMPMGRCTLKGTTLYVHLNEVAERVELTGLTARILSAKALKSGADVPFDDATKTLMPGAATFAGDAVTTLAVELDGAPTAP